VQRKDEYEHPCGISSAPQGKHMLTDLALRGHINDLSSDKPSEWLNGGWEYQHPHTVDLGEARRMVATLDKLSKAAERDHAWEHGDRVRSAVRALKLQFVATSPDDKPSEPLKAWAHVRWTYSEPAAVAAIVRRIVEVACDEHKANRDKYECWRR
jgi:hypothetical protein